MMIVIWAVVLLLLVFWSLLAWGLHALVQGDMPGLDGATNWLASTPLAIWVPEWRNWLDWSADMLQQMGAWLPTAVIVGWAIGVFMLLGLGVLASFMVWLLRRATRNPGTAPLTTGGSN